MVIEAGGTPSTTATASIVSCVGCTHGNSYRRLETTADDHASVIEALAILASLWPVRGIWHARPMRAGNLADIVLRAGTATGEPSTSFALDAQDAQAARRIRPPSGHRPRRTGPSCRRRPARGRMPTPSESYASSFSLWSFSGLHDPAAARARGSLRWAVDRSTCGGSRRRPDGSVLPPSSATPPRPSSRHIPARRRFCTCSSRPHPKLRFRNTRALAAPLYCPRSDNRR